MTEKGGPHTAAPDGWRDPGLRRPDAPRVTTRSVVPCADLTRQNAAFAINQIFEMVALSTTTCPRRASGHRLSRAQNGLVGVPSTTSSSGRLAGAERRESLLDAAAELLAEGAADGVSMEAVAERAGVSRPLVYKHFSNRDEILAAVYVREAALLHEEMAREVAASRSVEEMFRVLIRAGLRASRDRGPLFAALRNAGAWSRQVAREQRSRDAETARAFTRRARQELGLDSRAKPAIGLLLSMVDHVLAQYRMKPTAARAAQLESAYMTIVSSTLAALPRADRSE